MATLGKLRRRRFGEILVGDGLISQEQLDEALEVQKASGDTLGSILLDLGFIVETDIVKALSIQYQLPYLRPANYDLDRSLLSEFDPLFLHTHLILPIDRIGNLLIVLLQDIPTQKVLEHVQEICNCDLGIFLGTSSDIRKALQEVVPISDEQRDQIKKSRLATRGRGRRRAADPQSGEQASDSTLEQLNLSSENLLSSLDAAWDSIFVESEEKET